MYNLNYLFEKVKKEINEILNETRGRKAKANVGRNLKDKNAIQTVLMLLLATLKGWNLSQVHRKVTSYFSPVYRKMLGLKLGEIAPYSTFAFRTDHKRIKEIQNRLFRRLLIPLLNCCSLSLLAIDMTDLPRDLRDKLANYGVCGKGYFYGYKLHLIVTRDGVPLAVVATKANKTEPSVTDRLINQLRKNLTKFQLEKLRSGVSDAGYDTINIYDSFSDLSVQLVSAVNPRNNSSLKGELSREYRSKLKESSTPRDRGILLYHSKRGGKLYNQRIVVEQVIDQLKNDLRLSDLPWWVRGVRKIKEYLDRAVLAFVAILHCNKLRRNDLRNLTPYLA